MDEVRFYYTLQTHAHRPTPNINKSRLSATNIMMWRWRLWTIGTYFVQSALCRRYFIIVVYPFLHHTNSHATQTSQIDKTEVKSDAKILSTCSGKDNTLPTALTYATYENIYHINCSFILNQFELTINHTQCEIWASIPAATNDGNELLEFSSNVLLNRVINTGEGRM